MLRIGVFVVTHMTANLFVVIATRVGIFAALTVFDILRPFLPSFWS
jgi:hypothetical protein